MAGVRPGFWRRRRTRRRKEAAEVWVRGCDSLKPQSCGCGREEVEAGHPARRYETPAEGPGGLHTHTNRHTQDDARVPGDLKKNI